MKGLTNVIFFAASILLLSFTNIANAKHHQEKHGMWVCETNASSSANQADKNADDTMSKHGKSAKDAFNFAFKHCRDCTKITCTQENK